MMPPYARRWRPGTEHLAVWVYIGDWDRAGRESAAGWPVLVCDQDPATYTWPVRGRDMVIMCSTQTADDTLSRLADCLIRAGAATIATLGRCRAHIWMPVTT